MADKIYVLAPVDDILEEIGLPKTKPLLNAVSPRTVLTDKLGITSPGEILEGIVEEASSGLSPGRLPAPPGFGR